MKYLAYTETDIDTELMELKTSLGQFPTTQQIASLRPTLLNAIYKQGLNYNYFRNKIEGTVVKRANGFWHNFDNLETFIKPLVKNKMFPSLYTIAKASGGARESVRYFGGLRIVAQRMGYELSTFYKSRDGHHLRSCYEVIVDEFLYSRDICHDVDGQINKNYKYRYDFKIGDTFVEVWGYQDKYDDDRKNTYDKKRKLKERMYNALGLKLIGIESQLFHADHHTMENELCNIFSKFNQIKKREFNVDEIETTVGFWDEARILKEIKKLISDLGKFPQYNDMRAVKGLTAAVPKHGGVNHFRELLGYNQLKINYWNDKTILNELTIMYKNAGMMLSDGVLRKERSDLHSAISKRKGLAYYQKKLKENL